MSIYFTPKRFWHIATFIAAVISAGAAFMLEIFSGEGGRATAYEAAGSSIFLVIAIPLVLAALPLVPLGRAWVAVGYACAVAMIVYTVTGILSVGLLFLPATILAVIAAFVRPPEVQS